MIIVTLDPTYAQAHGLEPFIELPGKLVWLRKGHGDRLELRTTLELHLFALAAFSKLDVQ